MNNTNGTNGNGNNQQVTSSDIPLMLKARYFGSGVVVGAIISPMVKRVLAKAQPKLDSLMDALTGQAEGIVEKGSDLVAKAKDILAQSETAVAKADAEEEHEHKHGSNCTH